MSTALWGLTLVGPEIGVAAAEDTAPSSETSADSTTSTEKADSPEATDSDGPTRATHDSTATRESDDDDASAVMRRSIPSTADRESGDDKDVTGPDDDTDTTDTDNKSDTAESTADGGTSTTRDVESHDATPQYVTRSYSAPPAGAVTTPETGSATVVEPPSAAVAVEVEQSVPVAVSAVPGGGVETLTPPRSVVVSTTPPDYRRQFVADSIAGITGFSQSIISILPVGEQLQSWLYGAVMGTRRTLFNQAPWLSPAQISAQGAAPIHGTLGAVDLEGDTMLFGIVTGPSSGTLILNSDGTFVYTPNEGFTGVDHFVVSATDLGPHVNLFDLFRSASTVSSLLVNESAVTFAFNFATGSEYWTPEARAALQRAATQLVGQFIVTNPVIVTYDLTGQNSVGSGTLASAQSPLTGSGPGFFHTVVQAKLLTGIDANGPAADGEINWNFAYPWAFGDQVPTGQYDFTTVAMHELLHTFGFVSFVQLSTTDTRRNWTIYDSFLRTANGTSLIGPDYRFAPLLTGTLQGGDGGVRFGGIAAVDAYGALVPVYTPATWVEGSSVTHLDGTTFSGANRQLMNPLIPTGPGPRILSDIERGVMADLGYTLSPFDGTVLAMVVFVFIRRRRADG